MHFCLADLESCQCIMFLRDSNGSKVLSVHFKSESGRANLSVAEARPDAAYNVLCIHLAVLICQLGQLGPFGPHINVFGGLITLNEQSLRKLLMDSGRMLLSSPSPLYAIHALATHADGLQTDCMVGVLAPVAEAARISRICPMAPGYRCPPL